MWIVMWRLFHHHVDPVIQDMEYKLENIDNTIIIHAPLIL